MYLSLTHKGIQVLFFLILLLLFDTILGNGLRYLYFKQEGGSSSVATYIIDSCKDDVVVLGSSRASHHYVSRLIQDSLNIKCFNAGRDGNFLFYQYGLVKAMLLRHKPKLLVLDIFEDEFYIEFEKSNDYISSLAPYYNDHFELQDIIEKRGPFEKLKHVSAIYPYNSMALGIIKNQFSKDDLIASLGYLPIRLDSNRPAIKFEEVNEDNYVVDYSKLALLEEIVNFTLSQHVKIIIIQSPRYINTINNKANSLIQEKMKLLNVQYLDFSHDSLYINKPNIFNDRNHLNELGAVLFTTNILIPIKNELVN